MARNKSFDLAGDIRFKNTKNPPKAPVSNTSSAKADASPEYTMLNAEDILPSPFNDGLPQENISSYVKSMKETGLIEPIAVYDLGNGKYEILSGHQRYEAWCKRLGNKTIKAVILPYEKDPVKRFVAHTEANVLTRNKDIRFWLSRIRHAKQVLKDSGFTGSRAEELEKLSEMLNGVSQAQLYRYESFAKLVPQLQELESEHCMSANTLYLAVGLDKDQQIEVAKRVRALQQARAEKTPERLDDSEVTREEFSRIVADVRKGEKTTIGRRKKKTYTERVEKASAGFINAISRSRTQAERKEALECIARLRLQLDAIEKELS